MVEKIDFHPMDSEERLEDMIAEDISILDLNLLLIGRQVQTAYYKAIDLLAMDSDGSLVVIELKRDKTPREVVAQVLDYGSWVRDLEEDEIEEIFVKFLRKYRPNLAGRTLSEEFCEKFDAKKLPESLNERHELVVVASELDPSTERIVDYLTDEYGVAINAVFFRCFRDGDKEYLSRVWLIDPESVEKKSEKRRTRGVWNNEYYTCFGENERRHWKDGRKYGYLVAGGSPQYSGPLKKLEAGDRIWVNVPKHGYVGVGEVTEAATPISEFKIPGEGGEGLPITQVVENLPDSDKPLDQQEFFVRVDWIHTVELDGAVSEPDFFANQNIVARPVAKSWTYTVDTLKKMWGISD